MGTEMKRKTSFNLERFKRFVNELAYGDEVEKVYQ